MESRKMVLLNLFAGQQWRNRHRERLVDTVGEREGGTNWESSMETYITIGKIDSQWEFAVWCRELKPSALWPVVMIMQEPTGSLVHSYSPFPLSFLLKEPHFVPISSSQMFLEKLCPSSTTKRELCWFQPIMVTSNSTIPGLIWASPLARDWWSTSDTWCLKTSQC